MLSNTEDESPLSSDMYQSDSTLNDPGQIEADDGRGDDEELEIEVRDLKSSLADWQLRNRIPHIHCDALLKILNTYHPELPLCTRTLTGTSREKVQVTGMNR